MSTEVRLESMKLTNFKGIRDLEVEFNSKPATVRGQNESGKTSLVDAFTWALFGHDSTGSHKFKKWGKTWDENGEIIHHLDHEVVLRLAINSEGGQEELTLRRNYYEQWTKGSGENQEFRGHTTDYYINGAPQKKSDYERRINNILDEETFSLITNPTYFAQNLHWQERREKLLEMVEQPDIEEIIGRKPEVEKVLDEMEERNITKLSNFKDFLSDQIDELDEKIKKLPDRIDEARRNIQTRKATQEEFEQARAHLKAWKKELENEIAQAKAGGRKAKIKDQISEVETEMGNIEGDYAGANEERKARIREHSKKIEDEMGDLERKEEKLRGKIEDKQERLGEARGKLAQLQNKWDNWYEKSFEKDQKTCPTCGQELPPSQIEEKRKEFNREKSEKLESLEERGKAKKQQVEDLEKEIADTESEAEELHFKINEKIEEKEKVEQKRENLPDPTAQAHDDERWQELKAEKEQLQEKLENAGEPDLTAEEERVEELEEQIEQTEEEIAQIKASKKSENRVEELEARRRNLSADLENFERLEHLAEEYTRTRLKILQDRINSMFELANWTLFEEQVNGGIKDVCYPTYKGVPFSTLNGAGKIQVGLDIIKTLSAAYSTTAPIWIDQRESVATIPGMDAQVINLYHDPEQENLTVDVAAESTKEKAPF